MFDYTILYDIILCCNVVSYDIVYDHMTYARWIVDLEGVREAPHGSIVVDMLQYSIV